tara:strand:+ start:497 stop:859 length:363 start_codon:yes stop_codon:yes gene_type:complete
MCATTAAFADTAVAADTAASTMDEVVDAVFTLEQELQAAKTPAAIEAAKAKALAAGVALKTVEAALASITVPRTASATPSVAQLQPAVKKSLGIGGSTTASANSIPAGSTNIGDTGSTYN